MNTGKGWTTWARGDGSFVSGFVADSEASGFLPVLTLYQVRGSRPGAADSDEQAGDLANLDTRQTMRTYFEQLRLLLQRAATTGGPVVLHVEPDLWGYAERAADGDPAGVPAQVASTGLPELAGLPNTVSGLDALGAKFDLVFAEFADRDSARGHWRVKVGVFDPDWKRLYRWSENAAGFRVR